MLPADSVSKDYTYKRKYAEEEESKTVDEFCIEKEENWSDKFFIKHACQICRMQIYSNQSNSQDSGL